jgi:putative hydrolase of the HAD superfamily
MIGHYRHLFFDLDHTLWDFDANSRQALEVLYQRLELKSKGIHDFDLFHHNYLVHNEKLWDRYRNGFIKVEELRWKRMWLALIDFRIGDENLARQMGELFLDLLPTQKQLFPHTLEILEWLTARDYELHLITNGFEKTQFSKLKNSGIDKYFGEMITSEGSNSLKPHKEIFEYAIRKTGAQKERSIMIGDSIEVDIQGAINAGIDQVHVNHLRIKPIIQPTYMVYSLKELEQIF